MKPCFTTENADSKTEQVKKEKTSKAVAASKQRNEAGDKSEKDKQKEKEEAKAKAEEQAKKKAEDLAKKKAEVEAKKPISTDFSSFDNPYDKMTDIQKDEYWKKVKGKYVQWTGEVVEVKKDRISVICEDTTLTYDFVAYITNSQREKLIKGNKSLLKNSYL